MEFQESHYFVSPALAPAVDDEARTVLAAKANLRVVTADFTSLSKGAGRELRSILGAVLVQTRDRVTEASHPWPSSDLRVVTKRQPDAHEWKKPRRSPVSASHVNPSDTVAASAARRRAWRVIGISLWSALSGR